MNDYQKLLKLIGYPTISELYELEHSELSDFVIRGVKHIILDSLNLRALDSNSENYAERHTCKQVLRIYTSFEYIKEKPVEDFVDLGESIKVKIIEWNINVSSSKVLFIEINKPFLKQFNLFSV